MDLETYSKYQSISKKKLILGITSGRSGMKWFLDIMRLHDGVEGGAERDVQYEAFFRWIQHYQLNIDTTSIFDKIRSSINSDWQQNDVSVVVSPYLSLGLSKVVKELNPDFIVWGFAEPMFTITSFANKNIYDLDQRKPHENKAYLPLPFIDESLSLHQNIGRITPWPMTADWPAMSSKTKSAWFVNYLHMTIARQICRINTPIWLFDLQKYDQNYSEYLRLVEGFGLQNKLSERKFLRIKYKGSGLVTRPYRKKENRPIQLCGDELVAVRKEIQDYARMYKWLKRYDGWLPCGALNNYIEQNA